MPINWECMKWLLRGIPRLRSRSMASVGRIHPDPVLLAGMLRASEKVSDLIFSPGRPPQVEIHGQLMGVEIPEAEPFRRTTRAASPPI